MKSWSVSLTVFLAALGATILACWGIWAFMLQPTAEAVRTANRIHELFETSFPVSPRIHANAGALFPQAARTEEVVLMETSGTVKETLEGILPQAQALEVLSPYAARIGFRTRETFQINVRAGGHTADCTLPTPRILIVETSAIQVLKPENIDWDSLGEKAKQRAARALERGARRLVEDAQAPQKARTEFEEQISGILQSANCEAVFPRREIP